MTWVGLFVLLSLLGAACGGGSDDGGDGAAVDDTAPDEASADVDPDGVLRIGTGLTIPGGIHLDPAKAQTVFDLQFMQLVEGTLLRITPSGEIETMMAESYEIVDPQTVRFTIREGLEFTDSTAYDAQAVKDGLLRTRDQVAPESKAVQDPSIPQIADITVDGPLELTVKLSAPVAGQLVAAMAGMAGAIPSPAQAASAPADIDTKAIGAGPYTVVTFGAGGVTLKKNPDFIDADKWRIAEIQWVEVADAGAQQNGLRADAIDVAMFMTPQDAKALTDASGFAAASAFVEQSYLNMLMCMGKPPFDNEKVRQAINIGIDREQINDLVYEGLGAPAYGLWPEGHINYEPKLEKVLKYDPEEAKRLLAESGIPKVSFDMYYPSAAQPDLARTLEVMQAQMTKIGVDMKIIPGDILTQFVEPQNPGARTAPASRTGVGKYVSPFDPNSRAALCGVSHPEILELLEPATAAAPGDPSVAPLFHEADLLIAEHAYLITLVYVPRVATYSTDRVGGKMQQDGNGFPLYDGVYIKK